MSEPLIVFNKPYGVLCQFSDSQGRQTLADFIKAPDYYPAGRLDKDSEGLLLLTNNGRIQQRIADPAFKLPKTYLAQVEGNIEQSAINALSNGVDLKDGRAIAYDVKIVAEEASLWARHPPIRQRKHIPTSWISLTLREGRNRQVRRMTAAVGFPTLRLIRSTIGHFSVWALSPGEYRFATVSEIFQQP